MEFVERTEAEQAQLYLDGGQVRSEKLTNGYTITPLWEGGRDRGEGGGYDSDLVLRLCVQQ